MRVWQAALLGVLVAGDARASAPGGDYVAGQAFSALRLVSVADPAVACTPTAGSTEFTIDPLTGQIVLADDANSVYTDCRITLVSDPANSSSPARLRAELELAVDDDAGQVDVEDQSGVLLRKESLGSLTATLRVFLPGGRSVTMTESFAAFVDSSQTPRQLEGLPIGLWADAGDAFFEDAVFQFVAVRTSNPPLAGFYRATGALSGFQAELCDVARQAFDDAPSGRALLGPFLPVVENPFRDVVRKNLAPRPSGATCPDPGNSTAPCGDRDRNELGSARASKAVYSIVISLAESTLTDDSQHCP
jgi:hypothetical protein